jgi:uncharacterized protein with HEPN domain
MSDKKQRLWGFWLGDMLEAIEKIQTYTQGMTRESFLESAQTKDAVAMNIANIGECSTHLPQDITDQYTAVPWREIKAMRNLIAHDYPGIDWSLVWEVVTRRLPELEAQLLEIYKREVE